MGVSTFHRGAPDRGAVGANLLLYAVDSAAPAHTRAAAWLTEQLNGDHRVGIPMAILLAATEREMAEAPAAIETARETLTRLGARPFLARLDEARRVQAASSAAQAPELPSRSAAVPGDAPVGR